MGVLRYMEWACGAACSLVFNQWEMSSPHAHSCSASCPLHVAPQSFAEWVCGAIVIAPSQWKLARFSFYLFFPYSMLPSKERDWSDRRSLSASLMYSVVGPIILGAMSWFHQSISRAETFSDKSHYNFCAPCARLHMQNQPARPLLRAA